LVAITHASFRVVGETTFNNMDILKMDTTCTTASPSI